MPFPTRWAQTWIRLPEGGSQFPCYFQWWRYEGTFTADPFVWTLGANAFSDWFRFNLGQLVYSPTIAQASTNLFINDGATTWFYESSFGGNLYTIGDLLPSFKSVIIRRDGGIQRGEFGHFNLCGIDPSLVKSNFLTQDGVDAYQALCDATPMSVTHDGVTFTPITASYKLATAVDVQRFIVRPRLGLLRRRVHLHPGFLRPTTPKDPPV